MLSEMPPTSSRHLPRLSTEGNVEEKYGEAKQNLEILKKKGCLILHEGDAHTLSRHSLLRLCRFDRIAFNFPHAANVLGYSEDDPLLIKRHRQLVSGFLKNANKLLSYNGQIHTTHKRGNLFDQWKIVELAEDVGLKLAEEVKFRAGDYPGYSNKKGDGHGIRCDLSFRVGNCSTYMFTAAWLGFDDLSCPSVFTDSECFSCPSVFTDADYLVPDPSVFISHI